MLEGDCSPKGHDGGKQATRACSLPPFLDHSSRSKDPPIRMSATLLTKFSPPPPPSSPFHPQLSQLYYYGMRVVSESRLPDKRMESHSSSHTRSSAHTNAFSVMTRCLYHRY